jgi:hypothetical protein
MKVVLSIRTVRVRRDVMEECSAMEGMSLFFSAARTGKE